MAAALLEEDRVRSACQEALIEVLETMFFELPVEEPAQREPQEAARRALARFTGELEQQGLAGWLQVAIDPPMLSRLTQDFLGLDEMEAPGEEQTASVLGELANMLCGSTLSRLEPEARLRIATPEPDAETPPGTPVSGWMELPLECGSIWVRLAVQRGARGSV